MAHLHQFTHPNRAAPLSEMRAWWGARRQASNRWHVGVQNAIGVPHWEGNGVRWLPFFLSGGANLPNPGFLLSREVSSNGVAHHFKDLDSIGHRTRHHPGVLAKAEKPVPKILAVGCLRAGMREQQSLTDIKDSLPYRSLLQASEFPHRECLHNADDLHGESYHRLVFNRTPDPPALTCWRPLKISAFRERTSFL